MTAEQKKLCKDNIRLASYIAAKYIGKADFDDLQSAANLGLAKAALAYKTERAVRFSTFAAVVMHNEVRMCLRAAQKRPLTVSLDAPLNGRSDAGLYSEILPDPEPEPWESLEADCISDELWKSMKILSEDEECTLILLYGLDGGKQETQTDVAEFMGWSQSYLSRVAERARKKLRRALEVTL